MKSKTCLMVFSLLTAMPSMAMAGGTLTWAEDVQLTYSPPGPPLVNATANSGTTFAVIDFKDPRSLAGTNDEELIDFQGTASSITLYVTYASWGFQASNGGPNVPLFVSSFPSSPTPPQLDSAPTGSAPFDSLGIAPGDYTSSPLAVTLSGLNADGGTCLLLQTFSSTQYGVASIVFSETPPPPDPPVVPEPSSLLMLVTAMGGLILATRKPPISRLSRRTGR
jgi:hypothetical protein